MSDVVESGAGGINKLAAGFSSWAKKAPAILKKAVEAACSIVIKRAQTEYFVNTGGAVTIRTLVSRSGHLRKSIHKDVQMKGSEVVSAFIGTPVVYARIHELGGTTAPHVITPKRASVLSWIGRDGTRRFAQRVNHPGSKVPARPYLRPAIKDTKPQVLEIIKRQLMELWAKEAVK